PSLPRRSMLSAPGRFEALATVAGGGVAPPTTVFVSERDRSLCDRAGDGAELARRRSAEERDREDADDGDQRDQQRVLDERRASLGLASALQVRGEVD